MEDNRVNNILGEKKSGLITLVSIFGLLIITCVVYWPALSGVFILDDIHTLRSLNKMGGITSATNLMHFLHDGVGSLGRPISMLSLLIDDQYYPGDPGKYRYTNLMLHLLCGLVLLLFLFKVLDIVNVELSQRKLIATLVFALWLLHPLNTSTTLYIVQRMTQVMTLFVLLGLTTYVYGRWLLSSREKLGIGLVTAAITIFGLLAALSKENGILICLYVLVLEITVLRNVYKPNWFKYWLGIFALAPLVLLAGYIAFKFSNFLGTYAFRDFTLTERLLTESRVLLTYLYQIIIPPSSKTGLFHDDFSISTSLISPLSTLPAVLLVIVLIALAVRLRTSHPVFSFSILWFFGGHVLESTVIPLELYFEHRNYLPMVGPLFGIVYYCYVVVLRLQDKSYKRIVQAIPVFLIIISTIFTYQSAKIWGNPDIMYRVWYQEHPESLRAATMHAQMFEKYGNYSKAAELLEDTYRKHPDTVALLLYILKLSCQGNLPPKYNVEDVIKASQNAIYRNVLPTITKRLIDTVKETNCSYVKEDDLISILIATENLERLRGPAKAELILMLADLYIDKGMLSPAIDALDRAFLARKLPAIAVRQAELLSSAGLYDDALRYIEKAKLADSKRPVFQPSYLRIINLMEQQIQKQIQNMAPAIQ
jgi:tetratricopeptide (TPR) repeat protein